MIELTTWQEVAVLAIMLAILLAFMAWESYCWSKEKDK